MVQGAFSGRDSESDVSMESVVQRAPNSGQDEGGLPLANAGKDHLRCGRTICTDGPFTESKEAIGGYFLFCEDNLAEAIEIARQCPGLEHGAVVEIRPVAQECAASELVRQSEGTYANA